MKRRYQEPTDCELTSVAAVLALNCSVCKGEPTESASQSVPRSTKDSTSSDLPGSIKHLSNTFPFAPVFTDAVDLDYLIQNHLPPWQRARQLCELYLSQAPWFFGAVTKRQLLEECLPVWYSEASDLLLPGSMAPSTQPNPSGGSTQPQGKTSHELALLFVIFCFGALTDNSLPPAPDNEEANMYCYLTRAALNLEPVLDRPPSVTTIQTLALLAIYQGLVSGENSIECTWGIFGLATKLAQSVGDFLLGSSAHLMSGHKLLDWTSWVSPFMNGSLSSLEDRPRLCSLAVANFGSSETPRPVLGAVHHGWVASMSPLTLYSRPHFNEFCRRALQLAV